MTVRALECTHPSCAYVVVSTEKSALRYGCPHCRGPVNVTESPSKAELRARFESIHRHVRSDGGHRFGRALQRYSRRAVAKRMIQAEEERRDRRYREAASRDHQVAAFCRKCGGVTIFRRWPARLRRVAERTSARACAKCLEGPVDRIPEHGVSTGAAQLVKAVRDYAAQRQLADEQTEALFAAFSRASRDLRLRDAVFLPEAADPADLEIVKARLGRRHLARRARIRELAQKIAAQRTGRPSTKRHRKEQRGKGRRSSRGKVR